ncbi:Lipolytic enzyme, G-D-S-L [Sulfitobacter noctilucae]|uniref:SGNH/GDSL hydrolase family protein n=1 Tax=Sulfitobacter noctilucae TaxID=1342302 RepID=UPI00046A10CF|nr:SGNH/GDSL hydrolase family protein [Sulfitobacter noctilucae]KIN65488.1 Lipolytic enzyme, G-D-S-L [Sulfitobacter noctilucae]
MRLLLLALVLVLGTGTPGLTDPDPPRILVMGDSFMTSNGSSQQSFSHALRRGLNAFVKSTAVTGAMYVYRLPITGVVGLNITKQYRKGSWDYVVMNGGGNDLWLGCGCMRCAKRMARLISPDGTAGLIPDTVRQARAGGARVIYLGYLRSPGLGSPIEHCKDEGAALEARLRNMARRDSGVSFVSLADLVPQGDRSFHALDLIHPSPKGSAAAAARVIKLIQSLE